jgi:hypothetical protein
MEIEAKMKEKPYPNRTTVNYCEIIVGKPEREEEYRGGVLHNPRNSSQTA